MIVPIILAGGSGTRLWPLSRKAFPKQFLNLNGDHSLLQDTVLRAQSLKDVATPIVVCGEDHRFLVAEQLRAIGVSDACIILEPEARNTAPATALAAIQAETMHGSDVLLFVMSADHAIADTAAFVLATNAAVQEAQSERMVTFGITPTRPETGYGWLHLGAAVSDTANEVAAFVEKPNAASAQEYLDDGGYLWNGGLFLFRAGVFLAALQQLEPETAAACRAAVSDARVDLDFLRVDATAYARARNESIDYAVMEKVNNLVTVTLDARWDDVGTWEYLGSALADANGNCCLGDTLLEDTRDTLVHAGSRLVTAVGVSNHLIVETKDAVLVADRSRIQDVKHLVTRLQAAGREEVNTHAEVLRPWGRYETIAVGERFQVKRIVVKPGQKLSSQMHHHRAEHWIVVTGTARVTCGDDSFLLTENQSTYIPLGSTHRLENPGTVLLELIEVQSGSYLGEDDIVRFDDIYGRASEP